MKRLLSVLIILAMMLTMLFAVTSCGEEKDNKEDTKTEAPADDTAEDEADEGEEDDGMAEIFNTLKDVQIYAISDVNFANTSWEFRGGMIDGVEFEQEDVDGILASMGGKFVFSFGDEGVVNLENGAEVFEGTYTVVADDSFVYSVFENYEYYCAFTTVGEEVVLIAMSKTEPGQAYYFGLIEG